MYYLIFRIEISPLGTEYDVQCASLSNFLGGGGIHFFCPKIFVWRYICAQSSTWTCTCSCTQFFGGIHVQVCKWKKLEFAHMLGWSLMCSKLRIWPCTPLYTLHTLQCAPLHTLHTIAVPDTPCTTYAPCIHGVQGTQGCAGAQIYTRVRKYIQGCAGCVHRCKYTSRYTIVHVYTQNKNFRPKKKNGNTCRCTGASAHPGTR